MIEAQQHLAFKDTQTGELYRRIVGGLSWPAMPKPGALVVVAESWRLDQGLRARKLLVLAERQESTITELYRACLELRKLYQVDRWLADLSQKLEVQLFLREGKELMARGLEPVYLRPAPYTASNPALGIYAQLILELVQQGRKVLTFGAGSNLSGLLVACGPEELQQPAGRMPLLAALGFSVAELVLHEPGRHRQKEKPITTWDRYQWVGSR